MRDPSHPTRIVEGCCEGLGLTQIHQCTPQVARRNERYAQGEPEINGLFTCIARLLQMREGTERLLKVPHGLTVGRPRHSLLSRLATVHQGLVPYLTPQGMMR